MSDPALQQESLAQNNGPANGERPLSLTDRVRSLRLPQRQASAVGALSWVPWVLCLLLAASTAFFAFRPGGEEKSPLDVQNLNKTSPDVAKLPGDKSEPGNKDEIVHESKGYIVPISLIQISPLIGGKVVKLNIEEGNRVKKGDLLAQVEEDEYRAEYNHAVGAVQSAKRRLTELTKYRKMEEDQIEREWKEAEAQLAQLEKDYERNKVLHERNAVAARDFDLAESSYKSMKK